MLASTGFRAHLHLQLLVRLFWLLLIALTAQQSLVNCQLTWKGGLKYLVNPPSTKRQMMQQDDGYVDKAVDRESVSGDTLVLNSFVQKPTGRWW